MQLRQLKVLAVVAPILFLVTLEGLRFHLLAPYGPRMQVLVTMIALEMFGIVVFWWIVWRAIEAIERELRRLSVLEERERIAMDLHDGIVQKLYALGLSLEGAAELVEAEPGRVRSELDRAVDRLGGIIGDIRHYILDLRSGPPAGEAFATVLRRLADTILGEGQIEKEFRFVGDTDDLPRQLQWEVWHIAQEALANAARHGKPRRVTLSLVREGGRLTLTVADDGAGFEAAAWLGGEPAGGSPPDGRAHDGIRNMLRRARAVGGELRIASRPGEGTRVELRVPLERGREAEPEEAADPAGGL
ncbi:MAG: sensor histidine kinase [Clostridia bacterium]|nr:sensor histidine kinase [Clostridia bacterium]